MLRKRLVRLANGAIARVIEQNANCLVIRMGGKRRVYRGKFTVIPSRTFMKATA